MKDFYIFWIISKFRGIIAAIAITLMLAIPVTGQNIILEAKFDTSDIFIGDQVHFKLVVEKISAINIEFPAFEDTLVNGIEILSVGKIDTISLSSEKTRLQQEYLVTSFDSGIYVVPPLKFPFTFNHIQDTLQSSSSTLVVHTIQLEADKALYDIKPPIEVPLTFREIFIYIVLGILAIAIILLAIYLFRRYRKEKPLIPVKKVIIPAHITAIKELDALRNEKIWQQGKIKEYYTRLTNIIRKYIEQRFQVHAMEQTSEEILHSIRHIGFDDESTFKALRDLLTLADLVKFAKALPLPDENESNILNAYLFVNNTKIETDDNKRGDTNTKNDADHNEVTNPVSDTENESD